MRGLRRALQIVALTGTLLVGIVMFALIATQTGPFKDWVRRYIVRQANQYLNGELAIGRLSGNLFFGVRLDDVAVQMGNERVLAIDEVVLDYSVLDIISEGAVVDRIHLVRPVVALERTADGWNLARLVKERAQEEDREGPGRPISIRDIVVEDARLSIRDDPQDDGLNLPAEIENLDTRLRFAYEPVEYTIDLQSLTFEARQPDLQVREASGTIALNGPDVHFENVLLRTGESALRVEGVLDGGDAPTAYNLVAQAERLSVPEIARIVPAAEGIPLHPTFEIRTRGPLDAIAMELDVQSEAGAIDGTLTADLATPGRRVAGDLTVSRLNLAPVARRDALESEITGRANFDLQLGDSLEDLQGTYRFEGPTVRLAGYDASDVRAEGEIAGGRVKVDAALAAYGARASTEGSVTLPTADHALTLSLRGRADDLDLRRLPDALNVPELASRLDLNYEVDGRLDDLVVRTRLDRSVLEGATIASGTTARVVRRGSDLRYTADGAVADLDLRRMGRTLNIAALAAERFTSDLDVRFTVTGSGTQPDRLRLEASGELTDSELLGGRVPAMRFHTRYVNQALDVSAEGEFAGFDPAALAGQPRLAGEVNGRLDVEAQLGRVAGGLDPKAVTARGGVTLHDSHVAGVQIDSATVAGSYAEQVAHIDELLVSGPDIEAKAAGTLALNDTGTSNLQYQLHGADLQEIGRLIDRPLAGAATVEGTLTGNRGRLQTTGTVSGRSLAYGDDFSALQLNSEYTVGIPNLEFSQAEVQASTEAAFVQLGGQEITQIEAQTGYADRRVTFDTSVAQDSRDLTAKGDVVLHPEHQEIHLGAFAVRTRGVEWRLADGTEAAVQYGADAIRVSNLTLTSGDQRLSASGAIGRETPAPEPLQVQTTAVDLAALDQLLMLEDRELAGRLDASATVTGTLSAPRVEGEATIVDGAVDGYEYERLTAGVEYEDRALVLDAELQQAPGQNLTAKGRIPLGAPAASDTGATAAAPGWDLAVRTSQLDLGVIESVAPQVEEVTGTLQADVRVTGPADDPHVDGSVVIADGALTVPATGIRYVGLDTRIQLANDRAEIERFTVRDEEGNPLTVQGGLAVRPRGGVGAVEVSLTSENFEVIDNELGDVGVSVDMKVTGELTAPRVEGTVRVNTGRVNVDEILALLDDPYESPATEIGPPAPEPEGDAGPTGFDAVALDVRLELPSNVVLRGDDLQFRDAAPIGLGDVNITVGGDISVRKAVDEPLRVTGSVRTVRGFYEFQGRRFDIQRDGTIQFIGLEKIDPLLDITATRVISGVEARVHITGTPQQPVLVLSSTPPLDEADILSLIVFNQPINSLGEGQRVSLAERAGQLAAGFVVAPLVQSVGDALEIDLLEVQTGSDGSPAVTVGQQVGEDLYVKFRQQFGAADVSEFILEYQLADFLRLQTSIAEGSGASTRSLTRRVERGGLDLIFFFSY